MANGLVKKIMNIDKHHIICGANGVGTLAIINIYDNTVISTKTLPDVINDIAKLTRPSTYAVATNSGLLLLKRNKTNFKL